MTASQLSVSDLKMKAKVGISQRRVTATINNSQIRITAPSSPLFLGDLKGSFEFNQDQFRIYSAEYSTADAIVHASGVVGPWPDVPLDLKLKLSSGPKALGRFVDVLRPVKKQQVLRVDATALVQGTISDPVIKGDVAI
jgi:autotransporter translocation and assembly factor TamB